MSLIRRWRKSSTKIAMAEELRTAAAATATATGAATAAQTTVDSNGRKKWTWPSLLRWIPTSTDHIIASEKRLLSLVKTPFVVEQVNIGSGPPGSKIRWFRSASDEPRFINTVTFDNKDENSPTIVMVHGYGASQGFFFRNFDALARRFRVIAIDQLGWGGSSRPDFTCKSTEETEEWFIDSFEAWRKAKKLDSFILLGHSFGGYVAAKYALKHPEHVQHLILVGSAGFSAETDMSERLTQFRSTWKGAVLNHLWESNFTPQKLVRGLGPWGPNLVHKYTSARFGSYGTGELLNEEESKLLTDYIYHTLAAKGSGELCLKYIFSFGAFARKPLLHSASEWKVPTTFIYGYHDWMSYQGAQEARKHMKVPCEIIRVPEGGHFVFIDNASGFHSAVFHACRRFLSPDPDNESLPEGLTSA
ncbi:probable 1-acylglycerol-3-phosphate O-acyltransferase [Chenopodium quinoa]|uniref:1-acylglycerol-3-phosphate O-acyltransferase n=1 Tax=Chenopodium quinoa TaxID=63459 RepID=A0A803LKC2_CHEQI|nr:probable 1-acylglycerol-3-phosphate O-acyltransferase [Chenopodium quinoa]